MASMRADVERVAVTDTSERLDALDAAARDVRDAGRVAELVSSSSPDGFAVDVRLADPEG
jgi:hypothetical protein